MKNEGKEKSIKREKAFTNHASSSIIPRMTAEECGLIRKHIR
jgi:hypothetical protein